MNETARGYPRTARDGGGSNRQRYFPFCHYKYPEILYDAFNGVRTHPGKTLSEIKGLLGYRRGTPGAREITTSILILESAGVLMSSDEPVTFDQNRICARALIAGIPGIDGETHPHCIGSQCSEHEYCRYEAEFYHHNLIELRKGKEPVTGKQRRDRP